MGPATVKMPPTAKGLLQPNRNGGEVELVVGCFPQDFFIAAATSDLFCSMMLPGMTKAGRLWVAIELTDVAIYGVLNISKRMKDIVLALVF